MLIGAHVSVAGGYTKGLDYALSIGAECFQFFAKSPRQWRGPAINSEASASFRDARRAASYGPVFTHTAYLINLSTNDNGLREKSIAALADELMRCAALGCQGVVTHVGNHPDRDQDAAARRAGAAIRAAYDLAGEAGEGARLLLENTAGAGTSFGGTFRQLRDTIAETAMPAGQLGICLDTCHAFAHGAALGSPEGWQAVISEIRSEIGLERLSLIHANDCMFERGSHRDRHAWIGDGLIGSAGFMAMICATELSGVPVVTEMPGEVPDKDVVNLERLRFMRDSCAPSHMD